MSDEDISVATEEGVASPGPDENLSDEQIRELAEILYRMILDELRIERERLGR